MPSGPAWIRGVPQLRSEISSGRYQIDGTRIADGLLGELETDATDAREL